MKKYRNSVAILLVALLSLSIFYVSQAFSSSDLSDFYIKQTNGNSKFLDTLTLKGDYGLNGHYEEFTITKEGTKYLSELPFFQQLDYWEKDLTTAEIKDLTKKYASFMRGKRFDNQLYNDSTQIIYVDSNYDFSASSGIHDIRLKIDQLNKKTKETISFEAKLPNQGNGGYIDIYDVQLITNELRVITQSSSNNEYGPNMVHEYTFDLEKEKLIDDKSILITEKQTDQYYYELYSLTDLNPTQARSHFIFQSNKVHLEEDAEKSVSNDLYVYNYKTGVLDKLKLPNDLTKQLLQDNGSYYSLAYDENSLYAATIKDENASKTVHMVKYNFENQKITKNHIIQLNSEIYEQNITLYQDKLYLTYRGEEKKPYIKVFDFEDGKSIFEGTIEVKNNNQKIDYNEFYFYPLIGQ